MALFLTAQLAFAQEAMQAGNAPAADPAPAASAATPEATSAQAQSDIQPPAAQAQGAANPQNAAAPQPEPSAAPQTQPAGRSAAQNAPAGQIDGAPSEAFGGSEADGQQGRQSWRRRFPRFGRRGENGAFPTPPDFRQGQGGFPQRAPNGAYIQPNGGFNSLIAAQGVTPPPAASGNKDADADLQGPFYFVDESPVQVIKILEVLSGKIILQNSNLPNSKINFATKTKMPREEAVSAFESLLSLNGIAIIPLGEKYLKAVPSDAVNTQAPQFIMGKPSDLPVSLNFYTKLFELQYMPLEKLNDRLKPFLSSAKVASAELFPRSNSILITDTLANLQRVELLLEQLDRPAQIREDVGFIQLKNVSAEDMKLRLAAMQSDILKRYFENTTIDVDARTNQIIVFTQKGNLPFIKKIVEGLDIAAEPLLKSDVVYIKHGDAKDVVQVLTSVITGQQQAAKNASASKSKQNSATRAATQASGQNAGQNANKNAQASAKPASQPAASRDTDSGMQFSEYVTATADEWSNSIVIYGTPSDILQVKALISKLDIQLYQVKIDVIITEVALADKQVSGLSTFGLAFGAQGADSEWPSAPGLFSGKTSTYSLSSNTNPAFSVAANQDGFSAVFNIAQENTNVKVLSSPSITTSHNKEAFINVGQKYPIISSSTSDLINPGATRSSVSYQNIGIELKVLPRIGENGAVQVEISQKVETIIDYTTIDLNQQPIIGSREAESFISVQSGETIVLAGLQQVDVNDKDGKVWLLGDLPLIGSLFSPSSSEITRRELIIFIRPTVIKSSKASEVMKDKAIAASAIGAEVLDFFEDGRFYSRESISEKETDFEKNRFYNRLWQRPWSLIMPPEHKTVYGMLQQELDEGKRLYEEREKAAPDDNPAEKSGGDSAEPSQNAGRADSAKNLKDNKN